MHKHTLQHTIKKHATHTNRHSPRHNKHSPTLTHTRGHKAHSTSAYRQDLRSYAQQTKHTPHNAKGTTPKLHACTRTSTKYNMTENKTDKYPTNTAQTHRKWPQTCAPNLLWCTCFTQFKPRIRSLNRSWHRKGHQGIRDKTTRKEVADVDAGGQTRIRKNKKWIRGLKFEINSKINNKNMKKQENLNGSYKSCLMDSQWTTILDKVKFRQGGPVGPKFWQKLTNVINISKMLNKYEKMCWTKTTTNFSFRHFAWRRNTNGLPVDNG